MEGVVGPLRPLAPWWPPLSGKSFAVRSGGCTYIGQGCCGRVGSTRPAAGGVNKLLSTSY
eukprot:9225146-Pyramimonas_sp.AAC.1